METLNTKQATKKVTEKKATELNKQLLNAILTPSIDLKKQVVKDIQISLFDTLLSEVKNLGGANLTFELEVKKLDVQKLFINKQLSSKQKTELLKLINSYLKDIKTNIKITTLVDKESNKKELNEKQIFVKQVSEETRPLSQIIKAIKEVNKTNERYNFIFKKDFNLCIVNSFYSLSQFNNLLTKGNFHTETSIVSILDKLEKIDDTVLISHYESKGREINAIINAFKLGTLTLSEALNQFEGVKK